MTEPTSTSSAANAAQGASKKGFFGKTVDAVKSAAFKGTDFVKEKSGQAADKTKEAAHGMADKSKDMAHGATEKVKDSAHGLADKTKDMAHGATEKVKDSAHGVADKAKESAHSAAEKAKETAAHAKESAASHVPGHKDEEKNEEGKTEEEKEETDKAQAQSENTTKRARVAINGFGRIGRQILRIAMQEDTFDVIAINNPGDAATLAHLFEFDSNYGKFDGEVKLENDKLIVNGKSIQLLHELDPGKLPWKDLNIDIVLECTGVFRTREKSQPHIDAGAKKVVISAPAKSDDVATLVMGVNDDKIDLNSETIVSMASCTTNCITPVLKTLLAKFGIEKGDMCTIHSYTNDQNILDLSHKDLRRARAAAVSIIPTTTGAAKAAGLVIPELKGKLNGYAVRVPTPTVSLANLDLILSREVSTEEINNALKEAAAGELKGIMDVEEKELVSIDYRANNHSSIVDAGLTYTDGKLARVVAWYDNEWGYAHRMVDFAARFAKHI